MSAFFALIKFLWNNGSQVLALLEVLPDALQAAGSALVIAGDSATSAGTFIRGNGTGGANVRQALGRSVAAIVQVETDINTVRNHIVGMKGPFHDTGNIPELIDNVVERLSALSIQIGSVADEINAISGVFNNMGNDLKDVGEQLTNVGNELQQIN